jgi:ferric-dicitrate binding protein FerR (iron transport regulator)
MTQPENAKGARDMTFGAYDVDVEAEVRAELSEPDSADYGLVTRYLANELSPEDRERVEERLSTDPEFRALAEPLFMIWRIPLQLDREPNEADRIEAERAVAAFRKWLEVERYTVRSPALEEKRATWQRRLRIGLFALVSTILGALYEEYRSQRLPVPEPALFVHIDAPAYEERSERLPDETQVTLLAGSRLSYARLLSSSYERTLNLDGEGTFVVAPGPGALVVHGVAVEVRAGQGRFTVQAYDAVPIAYVTVQDGRALVRPRTALGDGESLTLQAGQAARVGPGLRIERVEAPIAPHTTKIESRGTTPDGQIPPDAIVRGPRELAPRGFALIDSIQRNFGERPHELAFTGKDTIDVTFWNGTFWRNDMQSKELPQGSLPLVRKAAEHVGGFVWTNYGRDAGINVIRITFVRMRKVSTALATRDVPAQEVTGLFTRKQLETGPPQVVSLTMTQR